MTNGSAASRSPAARGGPQARRACRGGAQEDGARAGRLRSLHRARRRRSRPGRGAGGDGAGSEQRTELHRGQALHRGSAGRRSASRRAFAERMARAQGRRSAGPRDRRGPARPRRSARRRSTARCATRSPPARALLTGGSRPPGQGFFYAPTVLADGPARHARRSTRRRSVRSPRSTRATRCRARGGARQRLALRPRRQRVERIGERAEALAARSRPGSVFVNGIVKSDAAPPVRRRQGARATAASWPRPESVSS